MLRDSHAAEEVTARAYVRLAEQMTRRAPLAPGETWSVRLGTIAHGFAVDEYRRRGREIPTGLGEDFDALELPQLRALTVDVAEFRASFDHAIRELPRPERESFTLTELRGLSQAESADVLGLSQPTVSRRADAARTFIAKELSGNT